MTLVFRSAASIPLGLGLLCLLLNTLVSRTGLHKRFNARTVCFFRNCLQSIMLKRVTKGNILKSELLNNFTDVIIIDSSSWSIPGKLQWIFPGSGGSASNANCKLQLCYNYKTGEIVLLEETPDTLPDQKYGEHILSVIKENALIIFDLGYWAFDTFWGLIQKQAFLLSRLKSKIQIWCKIGNDFIKIDLNQWLKNQYSSAVEAEVYIQKEGRFIGVRLIAWKIPEEVANARRMKLKEDARRKRYIASAESLALCDWSIFITNADSYMIPAKMIRSFYRARWDVELIFKSWKGVLNIHRTNVKDNAYRFECELYAKLILAIIVHGLYHYIHSRMWECEHRELSLDKLWKYIDSNKQELHEKIKEGFPRFIEYINSQLDRIKKQCEKYHQKSRETTLQRMDKIMGDSQPIKVLQNSFLNVLVA